MTSRPAVLRCSHSAHRALVAAHCRDHCRRQIAAIEERMIVAQECRPNAAPWLMDCRRQWVEALWSLPGDIQP